MSNSIIHKRLGQSSALFMLVDLSFALAVIGLLFPVCLVVVADTSGPGAPTGLGCPGIANAKGPCTDPHVYTRKGVGNGWCGTCGDVDYTYYGGVCKGTDSVSSNNCTECTRYPHITIREYETKPVGLAWIAGCLASTGVCVLADSALYAACGEVCFTTGAFTGGQSCYWCLVGVSGVGGGCVCLYSECMESCKFVGTSERGSVLACSNHYSGG